MKKLDLGSGVVITPARVSAATLNGWVALITGTDPKYELKRTFLDKDSAFRDGPNGRVYSARYSVPRNGLYEFRNIGAEGFFRVSGTFRKSVELVEQAEARRSAGIKE